MVNFLISPRLALVDLTEANAWRNYWLVCLFEILGSLLLNGFSIPAWNKLSHFPKTTENREQPKEICQIEQQQQLVRVGIALSRKRAQDSRSKISRSNLAERRMHFAHNFADARESRFNNSSQDFSIYFLNFSKISGSQRSQTLFIGF